MLPYFPVAFVTFYSLMMALYSSRSRIKTHLGGFEQGKQPKPVRTSVNGHVLTVLPGAKFAKGFFGNRDLAFTEAYAAVSGESSV